MTRIEVIPLQAEHMSAVASVHMDAFAGYPNTRLGRRYVERFLRWFAKDVSAIALVALDEEGQPCGYAVGAPVGYAKTLNRSLLPTIARELLMHPAAFLDKRIWCIARIRVGAMLSRTASQKSVSTLPDFPEPVVSLVAIGTSSRRRGEGIGTRLMEAFEDTARAKGARALRLSVYPENTTARSIYLRTGWTCEDRLPVPGTAIYYYKVLK